jgi:serine/threonine-protein kinase
MWDLERHTMSRFTFEPSAYPVWTPDGRMLVFTLFEKGIGNLTWRVSDGTAMEERLLEGTKSRYPTSVSADGSRLLFREEGGPTGLDLAVVTLGSGKAPEPLLVTEFNELNAEFSPDGRWLAYRSNESGRDEIYVRPFPDVAGTLWQISTDGGEQPAWAKSGDELFYRGLDGSLMRVPVELQPRFAAGTPTKLFEGGFMGGPGRAYDVSPDGSRFLMITEGQSSGDDSSPPQIVVVQNWFEELKGLAPTD